MQLLSPLDVNLLVRNPDRAEVANLTAVWVSCERCGVHTLLARFEPGVDPDEVTREAEAVGWRVREEPRMCNECVALTYLERTKGTVRRYVSWTEGERRAMESAADLLTPRMRRLVLLTEQGLTPHEIVTALRGTHQVKASAAGSNAAAARGRLRQVLWDRLRERRTKQEREQERQAEVLPFLDFAREYGTPNQWRVAYARLVQAQTFQDLAQERGVSRQAMHTAYANLARKYADRTLQKPPSI